MLGFFQRSYAIMLSMGYIIGICFQRSYAIMLSMGYVVGICWGSKIICYYAIYGVYSRNMLGFKDHMLLCYLWGI